VGPLLLPFAGGLASRVSWRVCVRPVIADDGLHRAYGERGAFLTADGERDGTQNHAILRGIETTSIRAFAGRAAARLRLAQVIAGVHGAAVLSNPRNGSRLDDFLKEEGIFAEVQARALKRALAEQLQESMQAAKRTKLDMAKKMATSRSQLDRVLDPSNVSVQLDTLIKAARALGKEIEIKIKRAAKKEAA
jgi:antitoxin HicB